ncbi:MAG: response regulator [Chloroflexi bacterium]|nr:response regulator [Chloroflexota bacterium]
MNPPAAAGFRFDARPTPRLTAGCLLVAGGLFFLFGPQAVPLYLLALLLLLAGALSLSLITRDTIAAAYVALFGLSGAIFLAQIWLHHTPLLWTLFLPTALAAVLVSVRCAFVVAAIQTVGALLLALPHPFSAIPTTAVQGILASWAAAGLLRAAYLPIYRILDWVWERYQTVEQTLDEIRNQRKVSLQALQALEHANRQLELTNKRLAAFRAMAEEAQQSKAMFVAKVSHEFRTPLNIITGLTSLLMEDSSAGTRQPISTLVNDLKVIRRNCAYLSDLINDVLDLSRAEAGYLTLQREWVDLRSLVESAVALVTPLVQKKQLDLVVNFSSAIPPVYCDRVRIRQVLLNLIGNAVRFTQTGSITVEARQCEQKVQVSVQDTGPGIPPAERERIFEPFCQASDNLWQDKGGTGLGLSISKQFIELHHGRMSLETEVGVGTTFRFTVPISPIEEPSESAVRWIDAEWLWRQHASQPVQSSRALTPRVVVLDRSGTLRRGLSGFEKGVEVVYVEDLPGLTAELQQAPAHAIVVNVENPGSLWQTVEQTRALIADMPITACSVPRDFRQRAQDYGVLAYLEKPITRSGLLGAMQRMEGTPRRILIAEDDPDMRWLLARMLEADSEVEIAIAQNGIDALEELRFQPPDLLLLDIMMPTLGGWELLAQKAQDPLLAPIPVILITGQDALQPPPAAQSILMTMGDGVPLGKLLQLSLQHSALLLGVEPRSRQIESGQELLLGDRLGAVQGSPQ